MVMFLMAILIGAGSGAFGASSTAAESPWTQILYGERGEIRLAQGRSSDGRMLRMSVETLAGDGAILSTTRYAHGKRRLVIERHYRSDGALEVRYLSEEESIALSIAPGGAPGSQIVTYLLHNGERFTFEINGGECRSSSALAELRKSLSSSKSVMPLLKHYSRRTANLRGAVPEAGDPLMLRVPDGDCLDACALECDRQCAFECNLGSFLFPGACALCKTSCAAGCLIGCSAN
jgi:hypothetical protein